ncbi:MAG: polysaccharide deacetylase family protein [Oscillospiraceae bacterium]|nr:polysaccharide deacetylase family protein [Oscillospiraceae bacterium]
MKKAQEEMRGKGGLCPSGGRILTSKVYTYIVCILVMLSLAACGTAGSPLGEDSTRLLRPVRSVGEVLGEEVAGQATAAAPTIPATSSIGPEIPAPEDGDWTDPPTEEERSPEMLPSPGQIIGGNVNNRRIDPSRPMLALTFDDGPSAHTSKILDLLDTYGGKATFFVIASRVERNASTIRRMADEGHEVLGHTVSHRSLTSSSLSERDIRREILEAHGAIEAIIGTPIAPMFRPPYGNVNQRLRDVSRDLGFAIVNWDIDTQDWRSRNAEAIHGVVEKNVRNRSIILAHDIHAPTAESMETVIPMLVEMGYQLVTLSELMHFSNKELTAGNLYTHGR